MGGFLMGSIMFSKFIPKLVVHKNICELSDDGNPGAFNAFKTCGVKIGSLCLALDILKGFIPVLVASLLINAQSPLFALVIIAPILGHAIGMFNGFHGGKCIATSFGVAAGLLSISFIPFALLAALYILFFAVIKIKSNRICSIIVYSIFGVASFIALMIMGKPVTGVGCLMIGIVAVVKHLKIKEFVDRKLKNYE
jgi:glycerol-3-phosphate acyltransferase PlsY